MERVSCRSDKTEGPTTGTVTVDPLEFLARVVNHHPRSRPTDPLAGPRCRELMRIGTVMTDPAVIARILAHRARARLIPPLAKLAAATATRTHCDIPGPSGPNPQRRGAPR